jgi:flagellar hook-length control protein FliK
MQILPSANKLVEPPARGRIEPPVPSGEAPFHSVLKAATERKPEGSNAPAKTSESTRDKPVVHSHAASKQTSTSENAAPKSGNQVSEKEGTEAIADVPATAPPAIETLPPGGAVKEALPDIASEPTAAGVSASTAQLLAWMYPAPVGTPDSGAKPSADNPAKAGVALTEKPSLAAVGLPTSGTRDDKKEAPGEVAGASGKVEIPLRSLADGRAKLSADPVVAKSNFDNPVNAASSETSPVPIASFQTTMLTAKADVQAGSALAPPVGTKAWDQAVGQKVVFMVTSGEHSATLTLNPPDLGPLQVVIHMKNDQAHASFTADQPEVRQALEAALPKLREIMQDAGIQLGQASVGAGFANQQSSQQGRASTRPSNGSPAGRIDDLGPASAPQVVTKNGLVDTFA